MSRDIFLLSTLNTRIKKYYVGSIQLNISCHKGPMWGTSSNCLTGLDDEGLETFFNSPVKGLRCGSLTCAFSCIFLKHIDIYSLKKSLGWGSSMETL